MLIQDYGVGPDEPWMGWDPWLRELGLSGDDRPRARLRVPDAALALRACREGAGLCVGRLSLAHAWLLRGELAPLLPWRSTEYAYYLLTRPADRHNPRVAALCQWLKDEVAAFVRGAQELGA